MHLFQPEIVLLFEGVCCSFSSNGKGTWAGDPASHPSIRSRFSMYSYITYHTEMLHVQFDCGSGSYQVVEYLRVFACFNFYTSH